LQVNSVFADPTEIENISKTTSQLSKTLKLNPTKLNKLLSKNKRFVWIKRKISDDEFNSLTKLSLKGIYTKHEYQRFYPNKKLCSHILGFTSIDENGLEGIELSFDKVLAGKAGYKLIARDALQRQIITPDTEIQFPRHGDNVMLTIDTNIQRFAEEELKIAFEKWKPASITAIVMDPMNGEILAMANCPDYDPNHFRKFPADSRRNFAITDFYEPGSLIKPIIVSGILEKGLITPDDVIFCNNGLCEIDGRVLHDAHGYGNLSVSEIITYSSNIGMAKLGMRMGKENMYEYLSKYKFGERFGIELPGEAGGIFRPLKQWSNKYTLVSISMGHEIAVTPLQFITTFCCIPNGGLLLRPKIVKSIIGNDNKTKEKFQTPQIEKRTMSSNVARNIVNPILMKVVTEGTGKNSLLSEYEVAGKTGTSQKTYSSGQYSHEKYVGSFIGYAPARNPRICVLVMVNEPQNGAYYGGTVAAPVVKEIIKQSLFYLGVKPTNLQMAMQ
jgi:cell division protein FtsI (penicillin-binding protein 3)